MSESSKTSRQFSLCRVMEAIVHCAPISRASIAKQTGLSKQTISEIARQLEEDGWIQETGRTSGHIGRTALTYEIVPDAACIAAVDLGGTKVRAAIANLSCKVLGEITEPTDPKGGAAVVAQIAKLCREVAHQNGIEYSKVRLVVVGVPGVPDNATGRVNMAPNISGIGEMDFIQALEDAVELDVIVENDVNLAVIGEHWVGNGEGVNDLVYLALGTGIGAGIMVSGEIVRGARSGGGELGFLPFGADPFDAESRRVGALERVAGSVGIKARYLEITGQEKEVPAIFDAAALGETDAVLVLDETAKYVARAIAAVCAVTNPTRVVIGGSIGCRPELFDRVQKLVPQVFPYPVDVMVSALDARVAIAGGAAVGLSQLHATLFAQGVRGAKIALPPANVVSFSRGIK